MKKFYTRLLLLLSVFAALPAVAKFEVSDTPTPRSEWQEGKTYLIEFGSQTSYSGKYLSSAGGFPTATIDSSTMFVIEQYGHNDIIDEDTYVLHNLKLGYIRPGNSGSFSANKAEACQFIFRSAHDPSVTGTDGTAYDFSSAAPAATENSVTFTYFNTSYTPAQQQSFVQFSMAQGALAYFFAYNNRGGAYATTSMNAWNLYEVRYVSDKQMDLQKLVDDFEDGDYANRYAGGPNPYQVEESYADAMMAAYNEAKTEVNVEHTQEEWSTYENNLRAAMTAAQEHVRYLSNGYYYIVTANNDYLSTHTAPAALYSNDGKLKWAPLSAGCDSTRFLVKVEMRNRYEGTMQSLSDAGYIIGAEKTNTGDLPVLTSTTPDRRLFVTHVSSGVAALQDAISTRMNTYFCQNGYADGDEGNVITGYQNNSGDAACWKFVVVSDSDLIHRGETALAQYELNNALAALIARAEKRLTQATNTKVAFISDPVVTDATQFSSNNKELSEGRYEDLLDGDEESYFHSAWKSESVQEDAPHTLQVASTETLPSSLVVYWKRRANNNENRPTQVEVSVSEDGENFAVIDTLSNPADGLPTDEKVKEFLSRPIAVGEGKTNIRFSVLSTNTVDKNPNGTGGKDENMHPYFSFSEFNLYAEAAWVTDSTTSQSVRAEMKPLCEALEGAILTAKGAWNTGLSQQSDIDSLQHALDALNEAWADSSVVTYAIENAQTILENAIFSDMQEVGTYLETSRQPLLDAIAVAQAAAPYYRYTAEEMNNIANALRQATKTFSRSMTHPAAGEWYYVESQTRTPMSQAISNKHIMFLDGYGKDHPVRWAGYADEANGNTRTMWLLKELNEPGTYALQNVGSGLYLGVLSGNEVPAVMSDTAVAFEFIPLGNKEISFRCIKSGYCAAAGINNNHAVMGSNVEKQGYFTSWKFVGIDRERVFAQKTYQAGRAYIVTLPYSTVSMPEATDADSNGGAEVTCYRLAGATVTDGAVSALHFAVIPAETMQPAGEPFLMVVGEKTDASTGNDNVQIDTYVDGENTVLVTTALAQNGMHGILSSISSDRIGLGYLNGADTVRVLPAEATVTLGDQEGYFVFDEVETLEGVTPTLTLPVEGGALVGIRSAKLHGNGSVNVITLDGVTVRRGVKAQEALKNLPKGIYIVGKEKKIVK